MKKSETGDQIKSFAKILYVLCILIAIISLLIGLSESNGIVILSSIVGAIIISFNYLLIKGFGELINDIAEIKIIAKKNFIDDLPDMDETLDK